MAGVTGSGAGVGSDGPASNAGLLDDPARARPKLQVLLLPSSLSRLLTVVKIAPNRDPLASSPASLLFEYRLFIPAKALENEDRNDGLLGGTAADVDVRGPSPNP